MSICWGLKFSIYNTLPYHPMLNPKLQYLVYKKIGHIQKIPIKKKNQLSIPSSLGVSIDYGHVLIFPNFNLQYLHHF